MSRIGPSTLNVAANITRLRGQQRLSLRQLSDALSDGPGKLSHASIGEVERGTRVVSVDELTSLAMTLGVSPVALLMPYSDDSWDETAEFSGVPLPLFAGGALRWLRGDGPPDPEDELYDPHAIEAYRRRSLPPWAWKQDPL